MPQARYDHPISKLRQSNRYARLTQLFNYSVQEECGFMWLILSVQIYYTISKPQIIHPASLIISTYYADPPQKDPKHPSEARTVGAGAKQWLMFFSGRIKRIFGFDTAICTV